MCSTILNLLLKIILRRNNLDNLLVDDFVKKLLRLALIFMSVLTGSAEAEDGFVTTPYFNWKALRLADAVKEIRGNGSRVIAVFTEPECGYCRKYEKTLAQVDNVTIYRFLIPLDARNTRASEIIWCAGNSNEVRLQQLHLAMQRRPTSSSTEKCSNPIAENIRFARKYDIYLTPTTIGADGRLVQGYLPLANLEQWLDGRGAFDK